MSQAFYQHLQAELDGIRAAGLFKAERVITTAQGAVVRTGDGREVINLCANNYLGLSSHPKVIGAASEALDEFGFGMASVRFICGAQDAASGTRSRRSRGSWARMMRSCSRPVSTPTAACSSRCWARRM